MVRGVEKKKHFLIPTQKMGAKTPPLFLRGLFKKVS
jgi:hypothetical protein